MKKTKILLLILCFIVSMGFATAKAANGSKQVTIAFSGLKLVIDGKQITVKNDVGDEVRPFVMDGVVYIPASTLSDALDLEGKYDSKTASYSVQKPTANPAKWIPIYDLPYESVSSANNFRTSNQSGIKYVGGAPGRDTEISSGRYQGSFEVVYALNGAASKISGTICKTAKSSDNYEATYEFYDNSNKLLYRSPTMTNNVNETKFEFNTGKATSLKLKITLLTRWSGTDCLIKDLNVYTTDY